MSFEIYISVVGLVWMLMKMVWLNIEYATRKQAKYEVSPPLRSLRLVTALVTYEMFVSTKYPR